MSEELVQISLTRKQARLARVLAWSNTHDLMQDENVWGRDNSKEIALSDSLWEAIAKVVPDTDWGGCDGPADLVEGRKEGSPQDLHLHLVR